MSNPQHISPRDAARRDLTVALKARDRVATAALRSMLAGWANAEAVTTPAPPTAGEGPIAGGVVRLGAAEVERRALDAAAAAAVRLEAEADVLRKYRTAHSR